MSGTPRSNSIREIICNILKASGKPMKSKEIVKLVLEKKQLQTKTPDSTVRAILQRSDNFVKVARATYTLKK